MARDSGFQNWPIGKKLGSGFGVTILLFLGVVWLYHDLFQRSMADYQRLRQDQQAKKYHALHIHRYLLEARRSEKDFLLYRDMAHVQRVDRFNERIRSEVNQLSRIEEWTDATPVGKRIIAAMDEYGATFQEIVAAWRTKGLDHESGLQGRFRETIHEVESRVSDLGEPHLLVSLLQIRRGEKDYLLRGGADYVARVRSLTDRFQRAVENTTMPEAGKKRLLSLMDRYRNDFLALVAQNDHIDAISGRMRTAAAAIQPLVEETVEEAIRQEKAGVKRSRRRSEMMVLSAQILAVVAIFAGTLLSLFITRQISSRIFTVVRLAEAFTDAVDEGEKPRNEVALLTLTMARMVATLQEMFAGLSDAAEQVDGVSRELGDRALNMVDQADRVVKMVEMADPAENLGQLKSDGQFESALDDMQDLTHMVKERSGHLNHIARELRQTVARFQG